MEDATPTMGRGLTELKFVYRRRSRRATRFMSPANFRGSTRAFNAPEMTTAVRRKANSGDHGWVEFQDDDREADPRASLWAVLFGLFAVPCQKRHDAV